MASLVELMAEFDAAAAEAAAVRRPPDPLAGHRDTLGEVPATLDGLLADPPPRLARARRDRLGHALEAARREVRRGLDALAPRGPA